MHDAATQGRRVTVRAAGGVPWRRRDGRLEVLLVHRPRYDDWTFPKGKCDGDESDEECAVREIEEETGLRVELGPELPSSVYPDAKGRSKQVRYWCTTPTGGTARAQNEVDEVEWLSPTDAAERLSYPRDLPVLEACVERCG